jgi:phosphoglycerate dehydrogenase-like enzyme
MLQWRRGFSSANKIDLTAVRGKSIGFVGIGRMGEAMLEGLLKSGSADASQIVVTDTHK